MYSCLEPEFCCEDTRGSLVQLVNENCAQVNILRTRAGVTRGGHYHKRSTEFFYVVSGSVNVAFECGTDHEEKMFQTGDFFEVLPGVVHTLRFPEDCVLVALYDKPVETSEGKDIYRGESENPRE